ncbi:Acid protease [Glarea lozoyensis ATCC 20868]|uniref:Probable aspartic-type endopeptidase OPSB n=1 Tax=Glarea lozoyensis (strain ATCC 20868 / MF5171) TaxID=1116229 RepID=S3CND2_GLAL2|nr:Acid protease [Glarea lozoyensis ATCC 20868]EPE27997.1 Acid protease [Glarea lozoyensis ATCC 20868]
MKGFSSLIFATSLLSTCTECLQLQRRSDGPARVVGLPIERKFVEDPVKRDRLRRRAGTVQASLDNEQTLYFANASLGTPAQTQRLHIDTGSSDLWVNTPESSLCQGRTRPCLLAGSYSANDSSTYEYIGSYFNISYVDGSGAAGDYVADTFTMGTATVSRLQFGVGYSSSSSEGILGIGYEINEVQVGRAGLAKYNNLPAQLVADGAIASNAYSLWLNDLDASTGNILFGGVDTEKFEGELTTLPIQAQSGVFAEFLVTLTAISLGGTVIARNQAQAVLLDSGSSLTYLPDAIAEAIFEQVGAQYDSTQETAFVPCSIASNSTTLDFTFSGTTIRVAMDELVIQVTSTNGRPLTFSDGTRACVFGVAPAGSSTAVLGDTFIRSAYLVYDLANNEISIAQTTFNATATNVLEITTGSDSVPSATAVTNPVAASQGLNEAPVAGVASRTSTRNVAQSTPAPLGFGAMAAVGAGLFYAAM